MPVTSSLIFWELKKNLTNGLSEDKKGFWDIWEIRSMVILSLFLQLILVVLGQRLRSKGSAKNLFVWLTYLSADLVATTGLGFLMRSEKEKFTELAAFWAPFLLLHLGGPDSITAYSLEDNELWLRHLLSYCFQVTVTVYVFFKFRGSAITYLALPMLIAAIIKYGERVWSLRSASEYKLKQSLYSISTIRHFENAKLNMLHFGMDVFDAKAQYLQISYTFFIFFKPLFLDFHLRFPNQFVQKGGFSDTLKAVPSVPKLIDTELGFLYDIIYTKRPLLNTCIGVTLRGFSFLCSCSALIAFSVIVSTDAAARKQHSTLDIGISFLLLFGAFALEVYLIRTHCLSVWTLLRAATNGNDLPPLIREASANKVESNYDGEDDMLIPQYNLINSCLKFWPLPYIDNENFLKLYFCTTWEKIELKKNIHTHLEKQIEAYIKKSVNDADQHKEDYSFGFIARIIEKRLGDDHVHRKAYDDMCLKDILGLAGFGECLLTWHLATDISYHLDAEAAENKNLLGYKTSKLVSDYMLYILLSASSMLVNKGSHEFMLQRTCVVMLFLISSLPEVERKHPEVVRATYRNYKFKSELRTNSRLSDAVVVARWLQKLTVEERWELMSQVWVETLAHVALNCPGKEHLRCLGRGGDLLTYVFLLLAHYGLSSKIHLIPAVENKSMGHDTSYEWAIQVRTALPKTRMPTTRMRVGGRLLGIDELRRIIIRPPYKIIF